MNMQITQVYQEEEDQEEESEDEDEEEESVDERPMKGKKRLARTEISSQEDAKSTKKREMAVSAGQIEVVDVDRKLKKQETRG